MGLINLPTDIIKQYQYLTSLLIIKELKEIQMLKEELSKYELKSLKK